MKIIKIEDIKVDELPFDFNELNTISCFDRDDVKREDDDYNYCNNYDRSITEVNMNDFMNEINQIILHIYNKSLTAN